MPDNVFDYAVAPSALVDAIRFLGILSGVVVFSAALVRWLQHNRPWQAWCFLSLGLFTSVQELTVLGQDFYPWRLTLLLVMNVCALRSMYLDSDGGHHAKG